MRGKGNGGGSGVAHQVPLVDLIVVALIAIVPWICAGLASGLPSGNSNLLFGRVLHVCRRNNRKTREEASRSANVRGPLSSVDLLSPLVSRSLFLSFSIYLSISQSRVVYSCRQCGWSREALLHELDNRSEPSTRVWIENIFRIQCVWYLTTRWNGSSIDWVYIPVNEFRQPARSYKMRWLVQINDVS